MIKKIEAHNPRPMQAVNPHERPSHLGRSLFKRARTSPPEEAAMDALLCRLGNGITSEIVTAVLQVPLHQGINLTPRAKASTLLFQTSKRLHGHARRHGSGNMYIKPIALLSWLGAAIPGAVIYTGFTIGDVAGVESDVCGFNTLLHGPIVLRIRGATEGVLCAVLLAAPTTAETVTVHDSRLVLALGRV